MGERTPTPAQNSGTLTTNATPVNTTPAVAAPTAPQWQAVPGAKTVKLHGVEFTVQGYDPKSKRYILTCPDTEENRKPFPSNVPGVRQVRNQHETVANGVQYNRNLDTPDGKGLLTVTVPLGKNATEPSIQDLQAQAKQGVGKMHIVDRTTEQAQAKNEKKDEDKAWYDPTGWKFWAIVAATLGVAAIGYFGFRKGGWFRSKKRTPSTPSTPQTPDNPGTIIPDHEDEWGNENVDTNTNTNTNTNTGNTTHIPTDTTTNTGSATTIVGNAADSAVKVPDGSTSVHVSNNLQFGADKDY